MCKFWTGSGAASAQPMSKAQRMRAFFAKRLLATGEACSIESLWNHLAWLVSQHVRTSGPARAGLNAIDRLPTNLSLLDAGSCISD
jgi:hypothetical protein